MNQKCTKHGWKRLALSQNIKCLIVSFCKTTRKVFVISFGITWDEKKQFVLSTNPTFPQILYSSGQWTPIEW